MQQRRLEEKSISFKERLKKYQISDDKFQQHIQNFIRANSKRALEKKESLITIRYLLSVISIWDEKTQDLKLRIQYFQDRCRFDLISHFYLRYIDRYDSHQPANASRGWIIFPVLRDPTYKTKGRKDSEYGRIVGFFLGSFKDSRQDGMGYFENLEISNVKNEFSHLITDIKTVIKIISRIENREIYYNDIKKQAEQMRIDNDNERIFAHANKYLFGSLAYDAQKIREEIKGTSFFHNNNLPNLAEEYYLKCNLISDNYNRREAMNKGRKDFLNYKCTTIELHYFFQYLFIVNYFSSKKGSYQLTFPRRHLGMIENILLLKDFKDFNQFKGDINEIYNLLFEKHNVALEVLPRDLKIKIPIESAELHAHYYFNFLALVNNFFAYWVKEPKSKESYILHFIYDKNKKHLYLFQSKTGPNFSQKYDFRSYNYEIEKYIKKRSKDFKWEELKEIGIGIRHVKSFFKQVFNSNFFIFRHREIKHKNHLKNTKISYNDIVYQYIDNINEKLLTLDHEKI